MTEAYYTCPLQAAYMNKEFGVKYGIKHYGKIVWDCTGDIMSDDWHPIQEVDEIIGDVRMHDEYYIHPDSMSVLEPQQGDVFCTIRPDAVSVEVVMSDIRAEEFKHLIKTQGAKIIQRDNKPFFWPKFEEQEK